MSRKGIDREQLRQEFYRQLPESAQTLAQTVRLMRQITGKTQPDFARLVGIAPRVLIDIERGVGNPTLNTLKKIGRPFGLVPGLLRPLPQQRED